MNGKRVQRAEMPPFWNVAEYTYRIMEELREYGECIVNVYHPEYDSRNALEHRVGAMRSRIYNAGRRMHVRVATTLVRDSQGMYVRGWVVDEKFTKR